MSSADLAHDYKSGSKKLIPIVFSHGLTASRFIYQVYAQELASNGYIVFIPDHIDGSCVYTKLSDGKVMKFDPS